MYKTNPWVIITTILLTAIIVGGGVYWYLTQELYTSIPVPRNSEENYQEEASQAEESVAEAKVTIEDIRNAFSNKYPDRDYSNMRITIDNNYQNQFVEGGVGVPDGFGAHYWAAKVDGEWIIVQEAQDMVPCSVFEPYGFPEEIVGNNCYNETNDLDSQEGTLTKIRADERFVYYSGKITVSGRYQEYYPETLLGNELCFYPDEETKHLIPRDPNLWGEGQGDTRLPWFCFENQEQAKEMFDINEEEIFSDETIKCIQGEAEIEISDYVVDTMESSVFDTARLIMIISKENYETQCE